MVALPRKFSNALLMLTAFALLPFTLPDLLSQTVGLIYNLVPNLERSPSIVMRPMITTFPFFFGLPLLI